VSVGLVFARVVEDRTRSHKRISAAMPQISSSDVLQGWGTVVIALVALHLLALAFWIFKVMSEPSPGKKSEEDKE